MRHGHDSRSVITPRLIAAALEATADEQLTGLALRLVLTGHIELPREDEPDLLTEAAVVFAPPKKVTTKAKPALVQQKKPTAKKQKAA